MFGLIRNETMCKDIPGYIYENNTCGAMLFVNDGAVVESYITPSDVSPQVWVEGYVA